MRLRNLFTGHRKPTAQPSKTVCPDCDGDGRATEDPFWLRWDDCLRCGGTGELAAKSPRDLTYWLGYRDDADEGDRS